MNVPKKQFQAHHQIILDSIADGVFTVDMEMNITSFNRAAENITRFSRKDAIGLPCYDVLRANVCEENCLLRQTIDTEQPVINFPVYILRADKKLIPISVTTALLKDAAGRVVGGVETFRDLTAVDKLRKVIRKQHSFEDIVSKNAKMLDLFAILPQVAESNCSVLIEGDSGTGKELFARAIHNSSPRRNGPFVAVNCGALPDSLCESELFGYKAGAFTDAKKDKPGRFALAENGTLFLDEIGDVSPAVQSRLLRVLEEKVYEPLGATETCASNARVITATNRNLQKMVGEGSFRDDLYFRIDIVKLSLPPLSKRKEDIPLLLEHFIDQFNHLTGKKIMGISRKAVAALMLYDWPGNVRELENAIEHAFVLCMEGIIRLHHLPARVVPQGGLTLESRGLSLREAEKRTILQALERNQWKKVATARELEIDKNTLRRKIIRLGIADPRA